MRLCTTLPLRSIEWIKRVLRFYYKLVIILEKMFGLLYNKLVHKEKGVEFVAE